MEKVGLIPAAGYARRLGGINGSKEMIPVMGEYGVEPVCHSLIRQFEAAGIKNIVLVTRKDKTDLLRHIETDLDFEVEITTVLLEQTNSTLESIFAASEFMRDNEVYLGFPDMIISPADAMSSLVRASDKSSAEVVLCAFPAKNPGKTDMIDISVDNLLLDIDIKNPGCRYKYSWGFACWGDAFTEYLYNSIWLEDFASNDKEIYIGDILQSYLMAGHRIEVDTINTGEFLDIGTPKDLQGILPKQKD